MNDWHKPALDGIGYQDSLNGERAWWTDYLSDGPLLAKTAAGKTVDKNALPILTYFDIFKNYYANTQEENFYMIGGSPVFNVKIDGKDIPNNDDIPGALGEITTASSITLSPPILTKEGVRLRVKTSINAKDQIS